MIGTDLRPWRYYLGFTQAHAAGELGVHEKTFQRWESSREHLPRLVELACERLTAKAAHRPTPGYEGDQHRQIDLLETNHHGQMRRILEALRTHGPLTRHDLEAITGIPLASVCARVHRLRECLLVEDGSVEHRHDGHQRQRIQLKGWAPTLLAPTIRTPEVAL